MFVRWMPKMRHTDECIDGAYENLLYYVFPPIAGPLPDGMTVLPMFRTRQQCRAYIAENYWYIRRSDLQRPPHGWRCPVPVKVTVTPLEPINDHRSRLRSMRARDSAKSHTHPRRHPRKVRT